MRQTGQADPDLLRRHVAALAGGPRGRRHTPRAMAEAEEYVAGELRAAGWDVFREPFDARLRVGSTDRQGHRAMPLKVRLHRGLSGANLRAELPGAGTAAAPGGAGAPTLVVGAHLDTVRGSPGADDNASGVAVVLETARLLGGLASRPAVTLMIFDMEELGLIGSRAAVKRLLRTGRAVGGMICLESVGFFSTEPGSQRLPAGAGLVMPEAVETVRRSGFRGDFTLVVHRRSSRTLAGTWSRAAAAASPALPAVLLRDPRPDGPLGAVAGLAVPALGNLDRSDHSPFWNHAIPAVMLTSTANFRNERYHRPGDTPDTLDYERLAAVATATATTAAAWPGGR
ncbi:M28 family peptidase [Streptomyces polygonati]|uniref:M28 family peptidase n=1 Tax=Streptomyces polygonati TaxID=1617087 RepID=A0ABV8HST1_9ACTN